MNGGNGQRTENREQGPNKNSIRVEERTAIGNWMKLGTRPKTGVYIGVLKRAFYARVTLRRIFRSDVSGFLSAV